MAKKLNSKQRKAQQRIFEESEAKRLKKLEEKKELLKQDKSAEENKVKKEHVSKSLNTKKSDQKKRIPLKQKIRSALIFFKSTIPSKRKVLINSGITLGITAVSGLYIWGLSYGFGFIADKIISII